MTLDEARNILGVVSSSSKEDIKQAFKKKALDTHPDRGGKNEDFVRVNEAYSILTGKQKTKEEFDFSGNAGFPGINLDDLFKNMHFNFDPFSNMFRQKRNDIPENDRQIYVQFNITVEDIKKGKTFHSEYTKSKKCEKCNGVGGKSKVKCSQCNGTGFRENRQQKGGYISVSKTGCYDCGGSGVQINDVCYDCGGSGTILYKERISFEVKEKK